MTPVRTSRAVAVAALVLAGCAPAVQQVPARAPDAMAAIDGPAADHARWVVERALTAEAGSRLDLPAHFAGDLLADDADALRRTLDAVRGTGPWEVQTARVTTGGSTAELVLRSRAGTHMLLHSTVDETGRAVVFWFGDAVDPALDPADPVDRARILSGVPARSGVSVGRVHSGRCVEVRTEGSDVATRLPLASVAKLMILDAVLELVAADVLAWSDGLVLAEQHRSLPPGDLARAPAGTTVTVEDAVERMLLHSDNTASDLLLDAVGRGAVERVYAEISGGIPPGPFWSTREVFELGWGTGSGGTIDEARRADVARRPLSTSALDVTGARWQVGLDWFLTPVQACDLGARLYERWGDLPPGVRSAVAVADVLLRKPGGVPGVVSGLWIVDGPAGPKVVTVQLAAERPTAVGDESGLMAVGDALASLP